MRPAAYVRELHFTMTPDRTNNHTIGSQSPYAGETLP